MFEMGTTSQLCCDPSHIRYAWLFIDWAGLIRTIGGSNVATAIQIAGQRAKKGERMTKGNKWWLAATRGKKRVFKGTLITTVNDGTTRLAIFRVPK